MMKPFKLEKAVSHREHRDHRGETKACNTEVIHLFGETKKYGEAASLSVFSVFSVNSVA